MMNGALFRRSSYRRLALVRWWAAWRAQWGDCVPRRLQRWWSVRQPPRLLAQVRGTDLYLFRVQGHEQLPLGLERGGALPRPRAGWREVVLELPETAILLRRARLPAQVRERLLAVVAYELDRLTPFTASEVYFAARVCEDRSAPPGQVELELAVCRRDQAAPWLERLRRGGVPAARLTWTGAWPEANLLPVTERPRQKRAPWVLTAALAMLVVLLAGAALLSPLWQKQREYQQIEQLLRQVRRQAEEVPALRAELERARAGSVAVLERKAHQPRMIDLLRELSARLPDDTWVQTLNFTETEVDLRGQSEQSTALLAVLEQTPGIANVTFRSPVMQIAQSNKERFHIAFVYRRPP